MPSDKSTNSKMQPRGPMDVAEQIAVPRPRDRHLSCRGQFAHYDHRPSTLLGQTQRLEFGFACSAQPLPLPTRAHPNRTRAPGIVWRFYTLAARPGELKHISVTVAEASDGDDADSSSQGSGRRSAGVLHQVGGGRRLVQVGTAARRLDLQRTPEARPTPYSYPLPVKPAQPQAGQPSIAPLRWACAAATDRRRASPGPTGL